MSIWHSCMLISTEKSKEPGCWVAIRCRCNPYDVKGSGDCNSQSLFADAESTTPKGLMNQSKQDVSFLLISLYCFERQPCHCFLLLFKKFNHGYLTLMCDYQKWSTFPWQSYWCVCVSLLLSKAQKQLTHLLRVLLVPADHTSWNSDNKGNYLCEKMFL